jgi:dipeptidyl aminopeptidase/acylaminoacyl peptidase
VGAVSPDGKLLALVENVSNADANIYLVDLTADAPEKQLLTPHEGNITYTSYGFTPDSSKLIYGTDANGEFVEAWTHDVASGEQAALVSADWDVQYAFYSPSGRYRVSAINADGVTEMSLLDAATGAPVSLSGIPDGEVTQVCFSDDEARIAFGVNTDTSPRNIYVADLTTGAATRLTNALPADVDEANLVTASIVRYPSFDGLEIPAIFYVPKTASAENPVPAVLWVHGGPGGQSQKGYSSTIQYLVNHGYAVLAANNRGSSGYGKTFFHMDDKRHGQEDLNDIVWGRTYLESLDYIDGDKIGIVGGSYGGFMTAAALAFHPEAFDAGIDIFGVTNWVRTLESIPPWWGSFRDALYDEMGDPAVDAERHRAISPLFHASNIIRPLLVIQGANDPRVLQVESDELVEAVRANAVPVEYVVFPDEGHGFQKKENRITAAETYLSFLDKYLRKEGTGDAQ